MAAMMVTPTSAPERRKGTGGAPRRYDWSKVQVGEWQNWLTPTADEQITDAEAYRRYVNLKNAAREWALRNGLRVQTRRLNHGRTTDLLFLSEGE